MSNPQEPLGPGTLVYGRYQIVRQIGRGGMGSVYEAIDTRLRNTVALKLLLVSGTGLSAAFEREARILAGLRHPTLPNVTDYFSDPLGQFLVMEFIPGKDLWGLLTEREAPFSFAEVVPWFQTLLGTLEYLHSQQPAIIHRDIKPQNLKLTPDGEIILLDFGLAKGGNSGFDTQQTASLFGYTPSFAPLEQIQGAGTEGRSDLYSLAATFYALLSNLSPPTALDRVATVIQGQPDPLRPLYELNSQVPHAFSVLIQNCMALNTIERPTSAAVVRSELLDMLRAGMPNVASSSVKSMSRPAVIDTMVQTTLSHPTTSAANMAPTAPQLNPPLTSRVRRFVSDAARKGTEALLNRFKPGRAAPAPLPTSPVSSPPTFPPAPVPSVPSVIDTDALSSPAMPPVAPFVPGASALTPPPQPQLGATGSSEPAPELPPAASPPPPVFPAPAIHSTIHLRPPVAPQPTAPTLRLRYPKVGRKSEQHLFEELILHHDYERLWRALAYAEGGRYLITGYGSFGGTSLLQCAMEKARQELEQYAYADGAMVALRFVVKHETQSAFELEADTLTLGHPKLSDQIKQSQQWNTLRAKAAVDSADSTSVPLALQLTTPLGATFLNLASNATVLPQPASGNYDFSRFVAELNAFFKQRQDHRALYQILTRFIGSDALPSRLVIIIDRVQHFETIQSLLQSDLLLNDRILLIVVARKEDHDAWEKSPQVLRSLGFSKWYVPCIWTVDLSQKLLEDLQISSGGVSPQRELFRKHLEYKGRGSLGLFIAELRNPHYTTLGPDMAVVDTVSIAGRAELRHNAWLQDFLSSNWSFILGDQFVGRDQDERRDRARIGVYHMLDWIAMTERFSEVELHGASNSMPIAIAADKSIVDKVLQRLLHALVACKYLSQSNTNYEVVWNSDKPPVVRQVRRRSTRPKAPQKAPFGGTTQPAVHQEGTVEETSAMGVPVTGATVLPPPPPPVETEIPPPALASQPVPEAPTKVPGGTVRLDPSALPPAEVPPHTSQQTVVFTDREPPTVPLSTIHIVDQSDVSSPSTPASAARASRRFEDEQQDDLDAHQVERLDIQFLQRDSASQEFEVLLLYSAAGEGDLRSEIPYTPDALIAVLKALQFRRSESADFKPEQLALLQQLGLLRNGRLVPDLLERVGKTLYKSLFKGEVYTALKIAQKSVHSAKGTVNVRLRFNEDAVELARLPWELLHSGQRHLVASRAVELTRYISFSEAPTPLRVKPPLHLLYVAPRPEIEGLPLLPDIEKQKVRSTLKDLEHEGKVRVSVLSSPTYSEFLNFLDLHSDVHVLHFDGHGTFARCCPYCWEQHQQLHYPHVEQCDRCGADISEIIAEGFLAFEQDEAETNREPAWISSTQLGNDLYSAKQLRMAVLSACSSATIREATLFNGIGPMLIQAGIPAVVATQLPISADAAAQFSEGFYGALANQKPIPAAVNAGRRRLTRWSEWFIPVLYLRSVDRRSADEERQLFRLV